MSKDTLLIIILKCNVFKRYGSQVYTSYTTSAHARVYTYMRVSGLRNLQISITIDPIDITYMEFLIPVPIVITKVGLFQIVCHFYELLLLLVSVRK